MAEFRFRAAAALDVRAKQEQAAAAVLAHAEAQFSEAERHLRMGEDARGRAQRDAERVGRQGADMATLGWHRNWIVGCTAAVDRLRRQVDVRAEAVADARQAWQHARRRRLALERYRERARRRFQYEQNRQDQKAMDELARIRYVLRTSGGNDL